MRKLLMTVFLQLLMGFTMYAQERGLDVTKQNNRPEQRVALVIGNGAYKDSPLPNPVNDARDIAQVLRETGFELIYHENISKIDMKRTIRDFGERIQKGGIGLFYFAGHGVQVNGKNYLIPTDATINHEYEVEDESVDLEFLLGQMAYAQNRLNIVILDACRNNPFARSFRSSSRGLAYVNAPSGTIIAYATAPGNIASDGNTRNSPYTEELLKYLHEPGLKIEEVFKRVRLGVQNKTGNKQIPWESSSLVGDFYFTPNRDANVPSVVQPVRNPESVSSSKSEKTGAVAANATSPKGKLDDKENPLLIGKRNINKHQINYYSSEKEVALGRQRALEIDRQSKFIDDPVITEYINHIGNDLALHSDAKVPFNIKIIDSNDVDAFALPGGYLYVNKGLILAANTEAELASVMAHMLAHVTSRHGVEQASRLNPFGSKPKLVDVFVRFSPDKEAEADMLGAQYTWATGYDPNYLITFFERIAKRDKVETASNPQNSHILTFERIAEVRKLTARFPARDKNIVDTAEFKPVQDRLVKITSR